jgi:hypothetical protein
MASLDKEIIALKREIEDFQVCARNAATSEARKDILYNLITARSNTLNLLLEQKRQEGK